jgi:ribonucleoside-diphosphate reductase alpha chain
MKIDRHYTKSYRPVREQIEWAKFDVLIKNKDGSVNFEQQGVEAPAHWSQIAVNILASKYLRKAGVPSDTIIASQHDFPMPLWLYPSQPAEDATFGAETSAAQAFHRMAGCWTYWGWREGLFDSEEDALAFYDEMFMMLARQVAAPNSPQWFNTGLYWAYGIDGPAQGHWATSPEDGRGSDETVELCEVTGSYERPQPSACFIQSIEDDLVGENGIMDLVHREARLFKYGSGSGSNFSKLRGKNEKLSGGGKASGLISFLEVLDRSAGAIKSGGTTRRAAKMVVVDADHPDVEEFIEWKVREEGKAAAMYVGSAMLRSGGTSTVPLPSALADRASVGIEVPDCDLDFEGVAMSAVSGQNANNSIRVTNVFMEAVKNKEPWNLTARTTGEVLKTIKAEGLWDRLCRSTWAAGDPGLQFHNTTNEWHTCAADGPINASNPCSEYLFLDDTACNLASLRLTAFLNEDGTIDLGAYRHAVWLWTIVLEISVYMASYPSREIARRSHLYRTLGLGYADLGGLLMRLGLPYDSEAGRALAAGLTSLMTGVAYLASAAMAEELGPFPRWEANAESMRRVLRNHAQAAGANHTAGYEGLTVYPMETEREGPVWEAAKDAWQAVLCSTSLRNAQVTLLAPTGTISFVMDCDTTGVEPDYALVKHKALAGGGSMMIINQAIPAALRRLGYDDEPAQQIINHVSETGAIPENKPDGSYRNYAVHDDDLDVFDCANPTYPGGRCLSPMSHVLMVAAVQPHLSGGVSKTVNLPNDATIADVSHVFKEAHRLGVKSIAPYRDGSKLTQPLSSSIERPTGKILKYKPAEDLPSSLRRGIREYLPWRRQHPANFDQKVKIGDNGLSLWVEVNHYPDGRPGEVWIKVSHEGSTLRAAFDLAAMMISVGLQYGVPVKEYVDRLIDLKFEPAGIVEGHDRIKMAQSIADFVGRELGITYLDRDELGQVTQITSPELGAELVALDKRAVGLGTGYTGDVCSACGNATMLRAGPCMRCDTCGDSTGCG